MLDFFVWNVAVTEPCYLTGTCAARLCGMSTLVDRRRSAFSCGWEIKILVKFLFLCLAKQGKYIGKTI